MKNVQIIDDAVNARYAIYSVTEAEFAVIFPDDGQNIEFDDDLLDRLGADRFVKLVTPIWERLVPKAEVSGIHGTLFYGLPEKKKFYKAKREPVIDCRLVE